MVGFVVASVFLVEPSNNNDKVQQGSEQRDTRRNLSVKNLHELLEDNVEEDNKKFNNRDEGMPEKLEMRAFLIIAAGAMIQQVGSVGLLCK